eukprot:m.445588 g.445588  ORF g.445588 m.445588 type:complete len:180 (+) comp21494_c0_seq7:135-674(+)
MPSGTGVIVLSIRSGSFLTGPLYRGAAAAEELFAMVLDAKARGARVVVGGKDVTNLGEGNLRQTCVLPCGPAGVTFAPTLLLNAPVTCSAMRDESFGPLLPVARVTSVEEAVTIAADSKYGLTGSVWTTDATVAKTFVDASDTGTCYVNWCNDVHARICWEGIVRLQVCTRSPAVLLES